MTISRKTTATPTTTRQGRNRGSLAAVATGLTALLFCAATSFSTSPASAASAGAATQAATAAPPSWAALYARYLAPGTVGDCASCHTEAKTADAAYGWLAQQQYMTGTPYLIDPRTSCFTWLGGDMPPQGPSSYPRAQKDFAAWAQAGAPAE